MKTSTALIITLTIALVIFSMTKITKADQQPTEIHIIPQTQTILPGETFTIDIYIKPAQPINAVEFKLSFSSSHLQAKEIIEGDLFKTPMLLRIGCSYILE